MPAPITCHSWDEAIAAMRRLSENDELDLYFWPARTASRYHRLPTAQRSGIEPEPTPTRIRDYDDHHGFGPRDLYPSITPAPDPADQAEVAALYAAWAHYW